MSEYCKKILITKLDTINGCSATNNKSIDAELLLSDDGSKIILIERPNNSLQAMAHYFANGSYTDENNVKHKFRSTNIWVSTNLRSLSIQL